MGGAIVIAGGGTAGHVFPGLSLARALTERGRGGVRGDRGGARGEAGPRGGLRVPRRAGPALRAQGLDRRAARAGRGAAGRRPVSRGRPRRAPPSWGWAGTRACRRSWPPGANASRWSCTSRTRSPGSRTACCRGWRRPWRSGSPTRARRSPAARGRHRATPSGRRSSPCARTGTRWSTEARRRFDLDPGRSTVVIVGGSQGALHLDQATVGACALLAPRSDLQVLLIAGPAHAEEMRRLLLADAGRALSGARRGVRGSNRPRLRGRRPGGGARRGQLDRRGGRVRPPRASGPVPACDGGAPGGERPRAAARRGSGRPCATTSSRPRVWPAGSPG